MEDRDTLEERKVGTSTLTCLLLCHYKEHIVISVERVWPRLFTLPPSTNTRETDATRSFSGLNLFLLHVLVRAMLFLRTLL